MSKAYQKIHDIILPEIQNSDVTSEQEKTFIIFTKTLTAFCGKKMALELFESKRQFSQFIETASLNNEITIRGLKSLGHSYVYCPEILDLTQAQRSAITLYCLLPEELKTASIHLNTNKSWEEISSTIPEEKGFLKFFTTRRSAFPFPIKDYLFEEIEKSLFSSSKANSKS